MSVSFIRLGHENLLDVLLFAAPTSLAASVCIWIWGSGWEFAILLRIDPRLLD